MAARIFRINYKSDFILTMNSEAGWEIPFCIKFWTSIPSRAYFVGYDGETYTHCAYDPSEPTKLMVQFDDHHLPIGNLHFQISYHFTVDDFPNNTEDEVFNEAALTTEIDGETYQVMLDFNGETAPGIDFSLPSVGVTSVNGKVGVVTLTAEDVGAQPTIADLATIRSGAAAGATAVQPATLQEGLATKQNVIEDLSTIRSGAAAGATAVQPATLQEGLATKQDVISDLATIRSGAAAGATAVQPAGLTPIESALQTIEAVIPSAASSQNQLADKNFVNSSISTNTANFVGTFETLAELQAVQNPTNNDYGFVIETDAQGNEYYDRYKYVASSQQWLFEYKVESTPFTADQWAAIQSGITSALVIKLTALPTAQQLSNQLAAKQDTISDLSTIRSGAAAGATAYQKPGTGIPSTDLAAAVQTSLERADEAAVRLYDTQSPDGMGYLVLDKEATFASQVTTANTIYEIRYDYDLNGQTVTIPAGCVLKFNGGSLANGTIVFNSTIINASDVVFKSNITISTSSTLAGDVKVVWFEGIENDSVKLNTLLNSGADNIYLNKTVYHVHGTQLVQDENLVDSQGNTYRKYNIGGEWLFCLLLNNITSKIHWNGATLQQDAESVSTCPIIGLINCHNIEICDVTIIGDKLTHTITTGQWCHGIAILPDCSDIEIHDVTIKENYGDGICLVNNSVNEEQATFYAKNISIHNCIFGNTIRNNISVISGENIDVRNNIFRRVDSDLNADGTALVTNCNAHLFIDMEMNYAWQTIKNVSVVDNSMYSNKIEIHNTSEGISFNSKGIIDNVRIIGNTIENCYYYGISWGSNNPSSLFFIKGNVIIGNSTYGALYSLTLTNSVIKNNVFKGTQIGIFGNDRVNVNGSSIYFPVSSQLNIYDCLFIDIPASSVYVANFFGCKFINSASLEFKMTRFVDCHFENCGTITCTSYNNMTDAQKETALQNKEALEAKGYVVGEDGDTYLSHDGNKFISCEFDGNSNETNPLLLNNGGNDAFVLQDTTIHNVNTSAYIFRTIADNPSITFNNVTFDNISSSIFTLDVSSTNTDILLRKVTIRNISVQASSLKPIYIIKAKSILFEDCNIEYSELYMSLSGVTIIHIATPSIAEIRNTIINTPNSSYRDRFLVSYKTAFGTLRNLIVNGVAFFADVAGEVGSRPGAPSLGLCYFNTTNGKPMWYNGTNWVDATGTVVV